MNNSNSSKKAASVGQDPNRVHVHTFCWEVQSKAPNIYQLSKPPGVLWKMQLSEERQKSGLVVAWEGENGEILVMNMGLLLEVIKNTLKLESAEVCSGLPSWC